MTLCSHPAHGYNHRTVARSSLSFIPLAATALVSMVSIAGCAAVLGPGYLVDQQQIHVEFSRQPAPSIHITAEYRVRNTGNRPLESLEIRTPGARYNPSNMLISWDGTSLPQIFSPDNHIDTLLRFPQSWTIGENHTLRFSYDLAAPSRDGATGISADAFYLAAEGWIPSLPQARGVFGFGGVPPQKWQLAVTIPQGFLIHASGKNEQHSGKGVTTEFRFEQSAEDLNPFVIAGRFLETRQDLPQKEKVTFWSLQQSEISGLQQAGDSLAKTLGFFDSFFGRRGKSHPPLWVVECPFAAGCSPQTTSNYSFLLYGSAENRSVEMISRDTVLIESHNSQNVSDALAGPALAAGWLGYGLNPGFYQQQPPMSALPAFASALAREAASGSRIRGEIVGRALAKIPVDATRASNSDPDITRAKSLLLFYALRDRVGPDPFQKAMQHMLYARQSRGFDITDMISALEEESHQPVGPFIREWLHSPGVPANFRAANSQSAVRQESFAQEEPR